MAANADRRIGVCGTVCGVEDTDVGSAEEKVEACPGGVCAEWDGVSHPYEVSGYSVGTPCTPCCSSEGQEGAEREGEREEEGERKGERERKGRRRKGRRRRRRRKKKG